MVENFEDGDTTYVTFETKDLVLATKIKPLIQDTRTTLGGDTNQNLKNKAWR